MSVKLNISRLETDYAGQYDYDNEFVPELQNAGASISREEIDGDTYMVIDGLETQETIDILNGLLIDGNADDYVIIDQSATDTDAIEPEENIAECTGNDCNPEFIDECDDDFIGESDDEYASIVVDFDSINENTSNIQKPEKKEAIPGVDFPLYENVKTNTEKMNKIIPGVDFPLYEDADIQKNPKRFDSRRDDFELNEAFKGISKPTNKKRGCCPPNGSYRSLNEALKAKDEKQQGKLDKSVKSIEDIIKSVKSTTIGAHEAAEALKKLKKEQRVLKSIEGENGNFNIDDVHGAKSALKAIANTSDENEKEVNKLYKAMKEKVENALIKRQKYLYENVTVNGHNLKDATLEGLNKLLTEAIKAKAKITNKLTKAINESVDTSSIKATLAKQNKLIRILEDEITYRVAASKRFAELNEDDNFESGTSGGSFTDDDLKNMFGNIDDTSSEDSTKSEENKDESSSKSEENKSEENKSEETEEVELSSINITLANKDAAEELKQKCIDAGIPEDAIEIEDETEENTENSDNTENSEENSDENKDENKDENSEENNNNSETPNESLKNNPNLKKLLEDEETNGDNTENTEDNNEESTEDENGVHFILTNTDYVDQLAQVLKDSYDISTEEFEEMIGGQIVNDENKDENSDENKDENSDENKDKNSDENKDENKDENSEDDNKISSDDLGNLFQGL